MFVTLHVYFEELIDSLVDGGNLGGPFLRDAILDAKSQSLSCKGVPASADAWG